MTLILVQCGDSWLVLGSMALQRRLLVAAGSLLIASLCPALAPAGTLLDTLLNKEVIEKLLGAIASVAGGNAANALEGFFPQTADDARLLENRHLTKAVGKAIAHIIEEQAQSYGGKTQKSLMRLAKRAEDQWVSLAQEEFALDEFPELKEMNLADVITPTENRFTQKTCLTVPLWLKICEKLYQPIAEGRSISPGVFANLAKELHTLFPKALREVLKRDFAEKGEAFAGLSLSLLTEMRKKLSDLQKSHHNETTLILNRFTEVERHLRGDKAEQRSFFNKLSQQLTEIQSSLSDLKEGQDETKKMIKENRDLLLAEKLPNKIYNCLLDFDYQIQQVEFEQFIEANPIGACLISGHEKSAQPWLIHRLLTKSDYFDLSMRVKQIKCSKFSQGSRLKKLICGQLEIEENSSIETIVDNIITKLETQSVAFVFKDVHETTSEAVNGFLMDFWQPLVNLYNERCKDSDLETRLIFIFVALDGVSNCWKIPCGESSQLRRSPFAHELYELTKIEHLSCDEVRKNLKQLKRNLELAMVPKEESKKVLMLLNRERNLDPQGQEDLLRYVYEECYGFNWLDFEKLWQNHYS